MTQSSQFDPKLLGLVAGHRHGVLATIAADGRPQVSNVLYVWDGEAGVARISTTADRAKGRNLSRDPRAALHVSGAHFWQFAVAEGPVTLSDVVTEPGDEAGRELQALYDAFYGPQDSDEFYRTAIRDRRLVVRLEVRRIYGIYLDQPPGS